VTVDALHQLSVEGLGGPLGVRRLRVRAALHELFVIEALVAAPARLPPVEELLGAPGRVLLGSASGDYTLTGVVDATALEHTGLRVTLAPDAAPLARNVQHRVLRDLDAVAIADSLLKQQELPRATRVAEMPAPRPQRVQAFESDLAFLSRILAEEGICWFVDQDGTGSAQMVLADEPSAFDAIVGEAVLPYVPDDSAGLGGGECVFAARLRQSLASDRASLRDYAFERPALDLSATAASGPGALEAYRFLGPGSYGDPGAGERLARRVLESQQRHALVLEGSSSCRRLWPGRVFELAGAARQDMNRRWLVVAVDMDGAELGDPSSATEERRFEARFRAIPADVPWRPEIARAPSMGGVLTATLSGPPGEEIYTDEHGRVTAKLRWDRDKAADDKASSLMRVVHPPTTGGFFQPRTGWEALVGFSGPSGDVPFVLGRLDNGGAPPAEALPGKKICSNFGTPTTPGGGSANLIRMNDSAGAEVMTLVASSNWDEQTAANKAMAVVGSETKSIAANHVLSCEAARGLKVDGAQTVAVAGNRCLTAASGIVTESGSEAVSIGGTREFVVGGDQTSLVGGALARSVGGARVKVAVAGNNRHVDAASTVLIGAAWLESGATANLSVAGVSTMTSSATSIKAGKYSLQASVLAETCAARAESATHIGLLVGGVANLTFGATVLKAPTVIISAPSITVIAGGGVLSVKPGSVTFTGAFSAGGHVRSQGTAKHG
jgi:type VI secretion system secreted protein VgrG